jgi:3',5'-cyclic AMP phosphodiesterase CpdA
MFTIAHISDIHLGPLPEVSYRDLASKRITGYVNWQRNRRLTFKDGTIGTIVADIRKHVPDHVAVTGDLTNLALDVEIELARQWLQTLGDPAGVSVIPGNHDAYVPGALGKACRAWRPWIGDAQAFAPTNENGFPSMRVRGPVALIGISSARATGPFMATGHLSAKQARRMGMLLEKAARQNLFRVIMIHHPPVRGAAEAHKRLFGIGLFQEVVRRHGAELVLHGHTHLPTLYWIAGKERTIPVVGVSAAGESQGGAKPLAQYNLIEISGEKRDRKIVLKRRGLKGLALQVCELAAEPLTPAEMVNA